MRFVWENSSTDLPLFYKISAFWGGMNGSLLFWELVLAGFAAAVAYGYQRTNREIIPYVIVTLNVVQAFLLFLLVTYSNPLALQSPAPLEGRGLNPLLQHPVMMIHPLMLYTGLVGFVGFRPFFDPPELQLLYGLLPAYWGRGLATEPAGAPMRYVLEEPDREEGRGGEGTHYEPLDHGIRLEGLG